VKVFGSEYIVRTDGAVLLEAYSPQTQTPVLDATTVVPLQGAVSVADSDLHGCAAFSDGTVSCWRSAASGNNQGQLGNGTTDTSGAIYRATRVLRAANTPLTNVKELAMGGRNPVTCAVTNDGNLYCWGNLTWVTNNGTSLSSPYGQVVTTDGATPLAGVLQAAVGASDICALVQGSGSKEVWCWGANSAYSLGQGDTTNRRYPVRVPGLTNPTKVAVDLSTYFANTTVCVLDGGNVVCLGSNGGGAAGTGDTTSAVMSPTLVKLQGGTTPLSGVVDLESGYEAFCALRDGGTAWCWGLHHQIYASSTGATNVVTVLGDRFSNPGSERYLTSDGVLHLEDGVTRKPNCGLLE
jgi:alpha-tubulin suppressor-like RCC1 family protein